VALDMQLMICVLTLLLCAGKKIRDKDVIELRTGGTGYAAHDGDKVVSQK